MDHTFVVLAYGECPHLDACLTSVLAQRGVTSTVIVATSTPSTFIDKIAMKHGVPVRTNPAGGSIAADWSFGYSIAQSRWLTLAHQDDAYAPEYLATLSQLVAARDDVLIAFAGFIEHTYGVARPTSVNHRIKRALSETTFLGRRFVSAPSAKRRMFLFGNPICCPTVLFNRERIGVLRFDETLHSNLDWAAWLALAERDGAFAYCRRALVWRQVHRDSATTALIQDSRRPHEDRRMFRQLWPAPVADAIAKVYRLSHRANET